MNTIRKALSIIVVREDMAAALHRWATRIHQAMAPQRVAEGYQGRHRASQELLHGETQLLPAVS